MKSIWLNLWIFSGFDVEPYAGNIKDIRSMFFLTKSIRGNTAEYRKIKLYYSPTLHHKIPEVIV